MKSRLRHLICWILQSWWKISLWRMSPKKFTNISFSTQFIGAYCKDFINKELQYLTQIIETKSIPWKIYRNSEIAHFTEINQALSPYSVLQHIDRVAAPKFVPRNCLRYLQTPLIMGGRGIGFRIYVRYCR